MLWWTSYRKFDSLQENATISLDLHVRLSLLFQNMEDSFPFNTPLGVFACLSWFQILNISYRKKSIHREVKPKYTRFYSFDLHLTIFK